MHDAREGLSASGIIVTGACRDRVAAAFEPVVESAVDRVRQVSAGSLYLYGSVATGAAVRGSSDVDLMTVGVPRSEAEAIGRELSGAFTGVCRGVEVGVVEPDDYVGDSDEAYGNRVFLRHYCVHLAGPDGRASLPDFLGDVRAARGFNGDLARHSERWREAIDHGDDASALGRRLARKTLLAMAGLVSVHDNCWTTDRAVAAKRWPAIDPSTGEGVKTLTRWADGHDVTTGKDIYDALNGIVASTTAAFAASIGLWPTPGMSW